MIPICYPVFENSLQSTALFIVLEKRKDDKSIKTFPLPRPTEPKTREKHLFLIIKHAIKIINDFGYRFIKFTDRTVSGKS